MNTVKIYRLEHLSHTLFQRLKSAQMESAQVWNLCMETHKAARGEHAKWPGRTELQKATKGKFALHSQSVQMVVHAFLANVETARQLKPTHPKMKYPWKTKRFYPVLWSAQAVSKETGRVVRQRHQRLGKITKKQSRCQKYSRRWKKLQRAKNTLCRRSERRIRDMRHKATHQVIDFCIENEVGSLFIGNPHGVRNRENGRHHNQRMALWEYGKDIDYLTHKAKAARILSSTGSERGTSSQCPRCGHKHKPKGRNWVCRACGFTGHRDLVGSVNMHRLAFGCQVMFPRSFTYLRPGNSRSSRRADTPQRCLSELAAQPLLVEQVSSETGHTAGVAQKPVSL